MRAIVFIAARHLRSRKLLNGIAVAGVTLGALTLIGITGIMRGFQNRFLDTILRISPHVVVVDTRLGTPESVVARRLGSPAAVAVTRATGPDRQRRIARPTALVAAIERLDGVAAVAAIVAGSAVASVRGEDVPVELRGIDPAAQDRVTPLRAHVVAGSLEALAGSVDGAMIGTGLAELLAIGIGDTFTCASARGARSALRVVALFETQFAAIDRGRVYVDRRLAQSILGRPDVIDRLEVRLVDPAGAPALAAELERLHGYDAESWQETNAGILDVFFQQNLITGLIIGAVLVVGGFGILAIQIMVVLEKRRDIALLKSVGYPPREILAIFLVEGAVVASLGAVVGGAAGHLLLRAMRQLPAASGMGYSRPSTFPIYERPLVYVLALGFAVAVGVLASLLPAWRAARVEPVDVLRGAG